MSPEEKDDLITELIETTGEQFEEIAKANYELGVKSRENEIRNSVDGFLIFIIVALSLTLIFT